MISSYSPTEAQNNQTFQSLMYPGRAHALENASLERMAQALLDLEVSYYTPDSLLDLALAATGAKRKAVCKADYLFYRL